MTRERDFLGLANTATVVPERTPRRAFCQDVQRIDLDAITPDPENARTVFDEDELQALAEDLKLHGQTQNAIVAESDAAGCYQLVAGERRWRACRLAGIKTLLCLVLPRNMPKDQREDIAFAENLARADLKPTEVARHWQRLMDRRKCTVRELAARVGVAPSTISKRLSLLKLDAETQSAVDAGKLKPTHAVEATRTKRRGTTKRRAPRGVFELAAGTFKLRRGHTLAEAAAELAAMVAQVEGREAA